MYAGSYLSTNLGHEVINMFQADNGKHYLYLNSRGNFEEKGKLVSHMLLVMHIGGKRVEVLALAKDLTPVGSAQCALPRNLSKKDNIISEAQRAYILGEYKNEENAKGGIHYGGVPLLELFGDAGQQNIFVSYEVEKGCFFKPKEKLILCFGKEDYQEGDVLLTEHNFGSTSLHQYILDGNSDYNVLMNFIEKSDSNNKNCIWEPSDEKVVLGTYPTHKISLFDICQIRHNENCFSNALAYYMEKYPTLWANFFRSRKEFSVPLEDSFSVSREVDAKIQDATYTENTGGRIDLLLSDDNIFVIIENKVKSDINKVERDLGVNQTQLDRYENYVKYLTQNIKVPQNQYFAFVLSPNYNKPRLDENKTFKTLTYKEICDYLEDKIAILHDDDFLAFYHAMRRHSFKYESLCQYEDMKNTFYTQIEAYHHQLSFTKLNFNTI